MTLDTPLFSLQPDAMIDASSDPLRTALLRELRDAPDGVSLARLCKRLRVRMSVLLRALAWLGEDAIGDVQGAGLVRVEQRGDLQVAVLTARGREAAAR